MYTYDIEQLLKDGSSIRLKPQGYSMYPLFHPGRDEAVIEAYPIHLLRRGDIILYRREQGILVLHRICRITSDGFYLVGDNQTEIEGPLRPDQIRGKLTGVVRNGKSFSVSHPVYPHAFLSLAFPAPHPPVFLAYHGTFSQNFFRAVSLQMTGCRKKSSASASFHSPHHFHNTLESPASSKEHTI